MTHLTDEQLNALHDGALAAAELAAAEAHVAACEVCRAALAELAALDASLDAALAHDPGDAYFAEFARRVDARISAEVTASADPAPAAVRPVREARAGRRAWWSFTPRAFGFAGAAAALVVTAGVAWMMFGRQQPDMGVLGGRPSKPLLLGVQSDSSSAPAPLASAVRATHGAADLAQRAAPSEPTAPASEALPVRGNALDQGVGGRADRPAEARQVPGTAPISARTDAELRRLREDKTLASGEPLTKQAARPAGAARKEAVAAAPVTDAPSAALFTAEAEAQKPQAAAVPAPATTSPEPAMQKRAAPSARDDAPKPVPAARSAWGNVKSLLPGQLPAKPQEESQAKGTALAPQAEGAGKEKDGVALGPRSVRKLGMASTGLALSAQPIEPPCGVVRDTRGAPLRGVQFMLLGARTRATRSGPDGAFCLEQPVVGDTLVVMHVGFEPVRFVLVNSAALALALEPIGTLGPHDGMALGRKGAAGSLLSDKRSSGVAPGADVYGGEPTELRELVAQAREAAAIAARERTPEAWERAAARWDAIGAATSGAPSYDARFRSLSALREALVLAPDSARSERFKAAAAAFVAGTPRTLPERATVQRWNTELRRYSSYR